MELPRTSLFPKLLRLLAFESLADIHAQITIVLKELNTKEAAARGALCFSDYL
jgi:hypothetical protein